MSRLSRRDLPGISQKAAGAIAKRFGVTVRPSELSEVNAILLGNNKLTSSEAGGYETASTTAVVGGKKWKSVRNDVSNSTSLNKSSSTNGIRNSSSSAKNSLISNTAVDKDDEDDSNNPNTTRKTAANAFTRIDNFTGPFQWMALEYQSPVYYDGILHPSALQAIIHAQFPDALPPDTYDANTLKKFINQQSERADWYKVRLKAVEQILRDKIRRSEDLQEKLKQTGTRELVWTNQTDSFLGQVNMRGQNHLGRILQEIRQNVLAGNELDAWVLLCNNVEMDKNARPLIRLTEKKQENVIKIHELANRPYFIFGKLPSSDIVALNPSISRKHALILLEKDCKVLLFDLKSKAKTFINGNAIQSDHIGHPINSNDIIKLGNSEREYHVEIVLANVLNYIDKKSKETSKEIMKLSNAINDPLGLLLSSQKKVYVGGLSFDTSREELLEMFESCGTITSIIIPQIGGAAAKRVEISSSGALEDSDNDADEDRTVRGFAFIEYGDAAGARNALLKSGRALNGRVIKVSLTDGNVRHEDGRAKGTRQRNFQEKRADIPHGESDIRRSAAKWTGEDEVNKRRHRSGGERKSRNLPSADYNMDSRTKLDSSYYGRRRTRSRSFEPNRSDSGHRSRRRRG